MNRDELIHYIRNIRNEELTDIDGKLRLINKNRLEPNHIEDKEKSIKWNMEYVDNFNADLDKQELALSKQRIKLIDNMYDALYDYLVEYGEGSITRNDAIRIVRFLPSNNYHFMDGVSITIYICEDIVNLFIEHKKELEGENKL